MASLVQQEAVGRAPWRPTVSSRSRRAAWAAMVLGLPSVVIAFWPEATALLQFDRTGLAAGELWRTVTAHWTHWSLDHLGWDLLAFVTLVFLGWRLSPQRTLATVLLSALTISAALWLDAAAMRFYRGLSGVDSALFALVAIELSRRARREGDRRLLRWIALAGVGFAAKVVFEVVTGASAFADSSNFVPVPLAHVVGGLSGALMAFISIQPRSRGDREGGSG